MIVFCGCSYLSGYGIEQKNSVASLLSEHMGTELINLSKPGGSNYCISKQVEHAISMNPDLIVFGTTEILRFDWVLPDISIDHTPSITDFSYHSYATGFLKGKSNIISESFRTLDAYLNGKNINKYIVEKYRNIDIDYLKLVHRYQSYTDFNFKKDQDKKIIESTMYLLSKSNIKWLLIDGNNFFDPDENIIKQEWKSLVEMDPQIDKLHFAEKANKLLMTLLREKL
jgi:hypothetical protein